MSGAVQVCASGHHTGCDCLTLSLCHRDFLTPQQAALAKRRAQKKESQRRLRAARTSDQAAADQAANTANRRQAHQQSALQQGTSRHDSPRTNNAELSARAFMTLNSLTFPPANRQPPFHALFSQSQAGPQSLHPGMTTAPAMH